MEHKGTVVTEVHPGFIVAELSWQDLARSCQEMVSRALDFSEQKSGFRGRGALAQALAVGNRTAHDYFRYALAKEIGHYLGHTGATVTAVYFFEPETSPEVPEERVSPTRGLDLIAHVTGDKEGLAPLVEALATQILHEYQALLGAVAEHVHRFLRVDVVDNHDVEQRVGSGALIASIYTRPTRIWSRFVIELAAEYCSTCGICSSACPYEAITISPGATAAKIDLDKCQLCGICYSACPAGAIELAYYDLMSLAHEVQSGVRATGLKAVALTCRGSTPPPEEIAEIVGAPGFVPICLPCVGRTPPEFFLKALTLGIEHIAVIPCKDDHCRFEDGSRIVRNRILLLKSMLQALNYGSESLTLHDAEGPVATVNEDLCTGCGTCMRVCPYDAIQAGGHDGQVLSLARVNPHLCQGCGICAASCPSRAIEINRFGVAEILAQIATALAGEPQGTAPRVLAFRCNWCSYGDSELPFGGVHLPSENIEVIRVPCMGRVDPLHVLWALLNGADGVFVGGCPAEKCRYISGSDQARERFGRLRTMLAAHNFEPRRLRVEQLKREHPDAFAETVQDFQQQIARLPQSALR